MAEHIVSKRWTRTGPAYRYVLVLKTSSFLPEVTWITLTGIFFFNYFFLSDYFFFLLVADREEFTKPFQSSGLKKFSKKCQIQVVKGKLKQRYRHKNNMKFYFTFGTLKSIF